ncbi:MULTISPECIES: FeoC-like transcriptional regulator [Vibrio]|uniref:Iron transporter FeoC n=2 Tax=Vibrio TaxID=662 RepID=A0AAJ3UV61_9VIBR|nr:MULTISPECIES: FeoC-like transcriptional regulator [Vibrio]ASI90158.1 iron transporter FeoC [Vibrio mediterranei]KFA99009.1 iron transporter FeoC [Vibrio sp. ER1A]MCG9623416.1 FeoC-like transcriptional regulator [Vibrio mediterranei]MCG9659799.1 FeoC-like transcriptional regulator [Vibrio mediterranei]MCG9664494.1 FeoC-like transcriptional regulator [Vibrio mediterranei]
MILTELKSFIEMHPGASRQEIAKKFSLSEDGVDAMLSVWIRKGTVSRMLDTNKSDQVTRVRYAMNRNDGLSVTVTM